MVTIDAITKHADVSRFMSGGATEHMGIELLVKLRRSLRDGKRAGYNRKDEAAPARRAERAGGPGSAYEAGYAVGKPSKININRKLAEAHTLGLPADLDAIVMRYLEEHRED